MENKQNRFQDKKIREGSLFDKWQYDSETYTEMCNDGKRRTLKEIRELKEKGIKVVDW